MLVNKNTPGTGFLGACLNCSQPIGSEHLPGCETVTGEYDPKRYRGLLHATRAQCESAEQQSEKP